MAETFTVRVFAWSDALALARPIRGTVFVEEQRVPLELEWDEWDALAEHALAFDARGRAIGTARLLPDGRIGRMAVLKEERSRGVGAALLRALLQSARERALPRAVLHAQTHAVGFYRKFGFSERGEVFLEAGIPHVEMQLELEPPPGSAGS